MQVCNSVLVDLILIALYILYFCFVSISLYVICNFVPFEIILIAYFLFHTFVFVFCELPCEFLMSQIVCLSILPYIPLFLGLTV